MFVKVRAKEKHCCNLIDQYLWGFSCKVYYILIRLTVPITDTKNISITAQGKVRCGCQANEMERRIWLTFSLGINKD